MVGTNQGNLLSRLCQATPGHGFVHPLSGYIVPGAPASPPALPRAAGAPRDRRRVAAPDGIEPARSRDRACSGLPAGRVPRTPRALYFMLGESCSSVRKGDWPQKGSKSAITSGRDFRNPCAFCASLWPSPVVRVLVAVAPSVSSFTVFAGSPSKATTRRSTPNERRHTYALRPGSSRPSRVACKAASALVPMSSLR